MATILVIDDEKSIRNTLKDILEHEGYTVETAENGQIGLNYIQEKDFDVVLCDIKMPQMDGIQATEKIISIQPDIKIIMCTVFDDEVNIFNAVCAGAKGYILKNESIEKIKRYIYETIEGGSAMSPEIAIRALNLIKKSPPPSEYVSKEEYNLSEREISVLEQIASGGSYDRIADNLGISYGTVRKHIENIYRKLNVHNKVEAINKAKKDGLL
jgi:DNA-binding NarL/FixJ family response regulator